MLIIDKNRSGIKGPVNSASGKRYKSILEKLIR